MGQKPTISVIIPAWNEAEHIRKAIKAIQEQDFPHPFEIIVVNNNSTDETFSIVKNTPSQIPLRIVNQTIQGTNATRQGGYEIALADLLVYCDADCAPPKNWLRAIYGYMEHDKYAAVSGPYSFGKTKSSNWFQKQYGLLFEYLTKRTFFGKKVAIMIGGNFAVRKKALDAIQGFPNIKFWGDDTCLALEIAHGYGPVLFAPDLIIQSSPRRFQGKGTFRALTTPFVSVWTSIKYIWAFLKIWIPFNPRKFRPRAKARLEF